MCPTVNQNIDITLTQQQRIVLVNPEKKDQIS